MIDRDIERTIGADHHARRAVGALAVRNGPPGGTETRVLVRPHRHYYGEGRIGTLDAVERLRTMVELDGLIR